MGTFAALRFRGAGKGAFAALRLFGLPPTYLKVRLRSPSRRAPRARTLSRAPVAGFLLLLLLGGSGLAARSAPAQDEGLAAARRNLMPVPAVVVWRGEPLGIGRDFAVSIEGPSGGVEPRVERAVGRMLRRLAVQTGIPVARRIESDPRRAQLRVEYVQAVGEVQQAVEDESYTLEVGVDGALLRAPTPYGVLRGLETFLQLVEGAPPNPAGATAGAP